MGHVVDRICVIFGNIMTELIIFVFKKWRNLGCLSSRIGLIITKILTKKCTTKILIIEAKSSENHASDICFRTSTFFRPAGNSCVCVYIINIHKHNFQKYSGFFVVVVVFKVGGGKKGRGTGRILSKLHAQYRAWHGAHSYDPKIMT